MSDEITTVKHSSMVEDTWKVGTFAPLDVDNYGQGELAVRVDQILDQNSPLRDVHPDHCQALAESMRTSGLDDARGMLVMLLSVS